MRTVFLMLVGLVLLAAVVVGSIAVFSGRGDDPHPVSTPEAGGPARITGQVSSVPDTSVQSPREEFSALAERIRNSDNPFWGYGELPELERQAAQTGVRLDVLINLHAKIAVEQLRLGNIEAAIESVNRAIDTVQITSMISIGTAELLRIRARAHLRQAEVQNCVQRHNRDCCIFPLRGGAIHTVREPAISAKQDLVRYLDLLYPGIQQDPQRQERVASGVWLLNIVCMALDEYPQGVPEKYRIPPAAFESEYDIGRFVDVAPQLGVDTFDLAGGTIVDDFDGDGLLDIVSSTCDPGGPLKAFRNRGDGTFEDVAARWKLDEQLGGLNLVGVDFNNDGRLDIFVLRGGWLFQDGEVRNSLLRQNADGTFTDVTREAGLLKPVAPTQTSAWADFDNDGWLDVYIGHEARTLMDGSSQPYSSVMYRNNQDGTFTDVTASAGVANDRYCKGVAAGDFDNDGHMDIYVSNIGVNRLYRNNGDMTFTDVAPQAEVTHPEGRSFATWFFDYDNDGRLDIFVAGYSASIAHLTVQALGASDGAVRPRLYRNLGEGRFMDVTDATGLGRAMLPMGANFGDFDNDGWLDMYLGTGDPGYESLMPNIALRSNRGLNFQDITQSSGLGHLQKGHGIAFADIDNDGDQDIYHQLGAFYPGDQFKNGLYVNPGHGNRFVAIDLVGTRSNRMAVGARVKVTIVTPDGRRELHRAAGSVSSFGGSPRRIEVGLERATVIESIEVWWPTSRTRQTFTSVPVDSFIRITEGEDAYETLAPVVFRLGATSGERPGE
ncbi:MAG: CRTAC1 family protein [Phycisphaeraceae bacterium]|nr:CRTAC1 family protein [Phycisphaeraceae bacterium]